MESFMHKMPNFLQYTALLTYKTLNKKLRYKLLHFLD